jgi:hypothetical protein
MRELILTGRRLSVPTVMDPLRQEVDLLMPRISNPAH